MFIFLFNFLLIFISLTMFFTNHPLAMGLFILIQTIIVSIISGMFLNTYWFSYILFMVFMGGLLVLFIYVSSIASNEIMKFSLYFKLWFTMSVMISLFCSLIFFKKIDLINLFKTYEMNNMLSLFYFSEENKLDLSKLYNNNNYFLTMLLILYLFITLIAVIKITNIFFGPLRSFNY